MAEKKSKTRSRYFIGEWYGRPFESFSPEQRRDQAKLHAGLTTIAGLDCPFQKNRICNKKEAFVLCANTSRSMTEPSKESDR
jgi:hypothetical protein